MGSIDNPAEFPGETDMPYPPRYRWLKRSTLIGVLAGIAAIVIYLGWSKIAAHRLQAEIDRIHARGEPILASDFQPAPPIADSDNAAWYYDQAFAVITKSPAKPVELDWENPPTGVKLASLQALIAAQAPALQWARQARQHPGADWSPKIGWRALHNTSWRDLAILENDSAINSYLQGDAGDAIESVRDLYHFAQSMDQIRNQGVLPHLETIVIDSISFSEIRELALDIKFFPDAAASQGMNTPSTATTQPHTARRQQLVDLIAEISDEHQFQAASQQMALNERAEILDEIRKNNLGASAIPAPLRDTAMVATSQDDGRIAIAAAEPNYPRAMARMPPARGRWADGPVHGLAHLTFLQDAFASMFFVRGPFRSLAERRAAVIALAIRLYRFDHGDQWPKQLSELVPAYLPAVPLDPFSPTDAPFQYNPDGPGGPIIYSVGENGIDNGGSELPIKSGTTPPSRWDTLDAVYHLTRPQAPTTVPTTAP